MDKGVRSLLVALTAIVSFALLTYLLRQFFSYFIERELSVVALVAFAFLPAIVLAVTYYTLPEKRIGWAYFAPIMVTILLTGVFSVLTPGSYFILYLVFGLFFTIISTGVVVSLHTLKPTLLAVVPAVLILMILGLNLVPSTTLTGFVIGVEEETALYDSDVDFGDYESIVIKDVEEEKVFPVEENTNWQLFRDCKRVDDCTLAPVELSCDQACYANSGSNALAPVNAKEYGEYMETWYFNNCLEEQTQCEVSLDDKYGAVCANKKCVKVDRCLAEPNVGPCNKNQEKYYFDSVSQECLSFNYGGCQGFVPFDSLSSCQASCQEIEEVVVPINFYYERRVKTSQRTINVNNRGEVFMSDRSKDTSTNTISGQLTQGQLTAFKQMILNIDFDKYATQYSCVEEDLAEGFDACPPKVDTEEVLLVLIGSESNSVETNYSEAMPRALRLLIDEAEIFGALATS